MVLNLMLIFLFFPGMAHTTNELASKTNIVEVNQVYMESKLWISVNLLCKSVHFRTTAAEVLPTQFHFTCY